MDERDVAGSILWLNLAWANQRQRGNFHVAMAVADFLIAFQQILLDIQIEQLNVRVPLSLRS